MTADLAAQMRFLVPLRLSFRGGLAYRTKMVVVGFDLGFGLAGYEIDLEGTYSCGVKSGCGASFHLQFGIF
jgi:hypothetical protein